MNPIRFITISALTILITACGQPEEPVSPTDPEPEDTMDFASNEPSLREATSDAGSPDPASGIDKTDPLWKLNVIEPPVQSFEPGQTYFWVLNTNKGTMRFRLLHESAPTHVSHLIHLTRIGFYDGTIFHRAVKGFMAQGGDPIGNGTGGPGYRIDLEIDPALSHTRGILSTANTGRPTSDGSQFFIMYETSEFLDGKYSIFGELVSGMETLAAFEAVSNQFDGPPTEPLKLMTASIEVESANP